MRARLIPIALLILISPHLPLHGADPRPGVAVVHRCDADQIGLQVVYETRQILARSSTLRLDESALLYISINCLDPHPNERGRESQMSYSVLFSLPGWEYPIVLHSGVQRVGRNRVDTAASSIVAQTDSTLPGLRRFLSQSGAVPNR